MEESTPLRVPVAQEPALLGRPLPPAAALAPSLPPRVLIVTGDDFGISTAVNQAILRAHREGILTSASLMVNGPAFREAVELARATPTLAVGLHLALSGSAATLDPDRIPSLLGEDGRFPASPARAGLKYYFSPSARRQLEGEIRAQIERFLSTGLAPDHVDGHHHLHMHPVIFSILVRACADYGIPALRIVRERLRLALRVDPGRRLSRLAHSAVFALLARSARGKVGELPIGTPDAVLGLFLDGRMTKERLLGLVASLPDGITEIYSHPSLDPDPARASQLKEFEALVAPEVREALRERSIRLTCYRDAQRAPLGRSEEREASPASVLPTPVRMDLPAPDRR
jgi:hopanoid biosynthesis associated protein HpnK